MRHWKLIISILVLLFVAGVGWAVNIFIWFGPDIATKDYPLELRTQQADAGGLLPDDLRAYEQAVLIGNKVAAIEANGLREPSFDSQSLEDQERIAAWVGAFEDSGLFEDFHQLGQIPAYIYPWTGSKLLSVAYTDELSAIRMIIRVGRLRVMAAVESGEPGAAIPTVRDQVRVAALFSTQPVAILRLTGMAILASSISNTLHLIQADLSPEEIAELVSIYDEIEMAPLQSLFDGELLLAEEAIASTFQSNVTLRIMSRGALSAKLNQVHGDASAWANLSHTERRQNPLPDPQLKWYELPVDVLLPGYEVLVKANDQIACRLEGLRVVLAIERFRVTHGTLPESLGQLVPDALNVLPRDPYADVDQPFGYRVIGDPSVHPGGYILYTVGYDGQDNGGQPSQSNPYQALSPDAPGTDFILNQSDWE